MNICVYCGSHDNLNTELTIQLDSKRIKVLICDEHSEEASIKTAKDAYLAKRAKIDEVLQAARALGLNISDEEATPSRSLVIPKQDMPKQHISNEQVQPKKAMTQAIPPQETIEEGFIPTSRLDSLRSVASVGGSTGYGSVESLSAHDFNSFSDKLPKELKNGVAKVDVLELRDGIPTPIPTIRRDGTGTTKISISKTDDNMLQNNFKRMANASMQDKVSFAQNGYQNQERPCPMCNGSGGSKSICTKCNGSGIIVIGTQY